MDAKRFSCGLFIDLKRLSILLTMKYCFVNGTIMGYEALSTTGFVRIFLDNVTQHKQLERFRKRKGGLWRTPRLGSRAIGVPVVCQ